MEIDQQTIILASIGDLEVTRRQLIMEIQARDERIAELEAKLAVYEPQETFPEDPMLNGQTTLEEVPTG